VPVAAAAMLGVSPADLVPYLVIALVVTLFAHANLDVPVGVWQRVVVTPGFHRSHHELGRESTNFAAVFPLLDVLFGTASFSVGERRFVDPGVRVQPVDS
jgi:sterol desaturase/sphingolipid hydroxylase (fatty acid hydroxylase superfamily)